MPSREPVITVGTISLVVSAVLTLLVSFGVHVNSEQNQAIIQFCTAVAPLVIGYLVARGKVSPVGRRHDDSLRR